MLDWLAIGVGALALLAAMAGADRRGHPGRWVLPAATVFVVVRALGFGLRWQLVPLYLLLAWLGLRWNRRRDRTGAARGTRVWRVAAGATGLLLLLLAGAATFVFPAFALPVPTGPHAVGTVSMHLVDSSRADPQTDDPTDHRDLMVRVWYPAAASAEGEPAPYWPNPRATSAAIAGAFGAPALVLRDVAETPSHALVDAPPALGAAPFPVLVFSHGLGIGFAAQNVVLMEELASHGYAIFSIDHTYLGLVSVFPDGRQTGYVPAPGHPEEDGNPEAEAAATRLAASEDTTEIVALLERLMTLGPRTMVSERDKITTGSRDQRLVMSHIAHLTRSSVPFGGRLDTTRVGVFGMSYGGKLAVVTCVVDTRCRAGANLDGFSPTAVETPPLEVPFLQMNSETIHLGLLLHERARGPSYHVRVLGAEHLDFTDVPFAVPALRLLGASGPIGGRRMLMLLNRYVLAFFDRHLRAAPGPVDAVLDGPAPEYPEAVLRIGSGTRAR